MKNTFDLPQEFLDFLNSGKEIPEEKWSEPHIKLNRQV